ncbi:MAG TPA: rRNA maturation RNase YbeY [Gemmatimonadaceae bacterium]|nr:rRNA maturation RNase YbeY [Gemmatimonadaceae bacterium]
MTAMVQIHSEAGRVPVSRQRMVAAVQTVLRAERERLASVSVSLVSTAVMRKLNRAHFGRGTPTDVISLGWRSPETGMLVGDIYIAPDVARASARRGGVGVREELMRLLVHGVLHAIGYDHSSGAARTEGPMWRRQERLVARVLREPAA